MRIDEISDYNQVLAFLADIQLYYQPTWLRVKYLLDYYLTSGDPVDATLVATCDLIDKNLYLIQTYEFDHTDSDLQQLLAEVVHIRKELDQYRRLLGI